MLLGRNTRFADQPLVGPFCGYGVRGGVIYLRGEVEPWEVGKECGIFTVDEVDLKVLRLMLEHASGGPSALFAFFPVADREHRAREEGRSPMDRVPLERPS